MADSNATTAPVGHEDYFPYPSSAFELSEVQRLGLRPLGVLACLSVLSSTGVVGFLTFRMIKSIPSRDFHLHRNQLIVLIYNLLWADLWQAFSFLFSFHWQSLDMILAPTNPCWTQAWFLHLGDIASGLFVLAIALHTYWRVFLGIGRNLSHKTFVMCILGIWGFSVLMASLSPIMRGSDAFVRAGSWCWINGKYETDRLWLHYFWIFVVECATIILYAAIGLKLRFHAREMRTLNVHRGIRSKIERSTKFMTIYPCIYVVLTLPLAFGRMYSMAHDGVALPDEYMITAGCLITSCGWMDALMYTFTRNLFTTREGSGDGSRDQYSERRGTATNTSNMLGTGSRARRSGNILFDDVTALRNHPGHHWDDDSDTTPPGTTTTTIIGGMKAEESHVVQSRHRLKSQLPMPPKAHRFFGIGRRSLDHELKHISESSELNDISSLPTSDGVGRTGRQSRRARYFSTSASNAQRARQRSSDTSITPLTTTDPALPPPGVAPNSHLRRKDSSGANSAQDASPFSPAFGESPYSCSEPHAPSRSRSPIASRRSKSGTEVPRAQAAAHGNAPAGEDCPPPPALTTDCLPFGQVKVETDIQVTSSEKRNGGGGSGAKSSRESSQELGR